MYIVVSGGLGKIAKLWWLFEIDQVVRKPYGSLSRSDS